MSTSPDIFLSYNRDDQAIARRFAQAFEAAGLRVWWDVTLRSGEAYDEVTEKALRESRAVVVLWSKKSVVSHSRWVRAEATLADRNRTLVPAMIESCERPIMFELTQTAELGHWQGEPDDKAWRAFVADVKRFVGRRTDPVAEASTLTLAGSEKHSKGERGGAPSMAVLPFANRSGLPEDEAFAAALVEDVIDLLSQGASVRVRASSATARFRAGGVADIKAVAQQLGVHYLLEGNVRRTAGKMRVTAQLVEAATGTILWTQRFERPLSELDLLQDELVAEVATTLNTTVYHMEISRALSAGDNITAWQAV